MNDVEILAERLRGSVLPVAAVAREAGVSRQAIMAIRDGEATNPGILTVQAISRALDALAAAATGSGAGGVSGDAASGSVSPAVSVVADVVESA